MKKIMDLKSNKKTSKPKIKYSLFLRWLKLTNTFIVTLVCKLYVVKLVLPLIFSFKQIEMIS